jgi:multiple sugar transport system substrate-binding protein
VKPFPQLYEKPAVFADGHSWALFKGGTKDAKAHEASVKFLKFVWDRSAEWSRTGHLPVSKTVAQERRLPRAAAARGADRESRRPASGMPGNVPTQRASSC